MSSRGREIHQPSRYGGCLQLQELDDDNDDVDHKPAVSRRGRKAHPKKFSGSVISQKLEEAVKNENQKTLNALVHTATGMCSYFRATSPSPSNIHPGNISPHISSGNLLPHFLVLHIDRIF